MYGGDAKFSSLASPSIQETIQDFSVGILPGTSSSVTLVGGGTANYEILLTPTNGSTFPAPVAFAVHGLPPGATATFAPTTVSSGAGTHHHHSNDPSSAKSIFQSLRDCAPAHIAADCNRNAPSRKTVDIAIFELASQSDRILVACVDARRCRNSDERLWRFITEQARTGPVGTDRLQRHGGSFIWDTYAFHGGHFDAGMRASR